MAILYSLVNEAKYHLKLNKKKTEGAIALMFHICLITYQCMTGKKITKIYSKLMFSPNGVGYIIYGEVLQRLIM